VNQGGKEKKEKSPMKTDILKSTKTKYKGVFMRQMNGTTTDRKGKHLRWEDWF